MREPIFTDWTAKHGEVWGKVPLRLSHRLHQSELFSRDTLAKLIENYPRSVTKLNTDPGYADTFRLSLRTPEPAAMHAHLRP